MENSTAPQTSSQIKFDKSFTELAENFSGETLKEFGESLGVDEQTLFAWADKKKKDENGNITDQLARPRFSAAIKKIAEKGKNQKTEKKQDAKPPLKQEIGEGDIVEGQPIKKEKLNPNQERFAKLYATDREFFGNGVQTYIEVYKPDKNKSGWYQNACASASEILSNPKVFNRINELLEVGGLNDVNVDKQLMFLINQHSDYSAKTAAIREYNKLKNRITEKIDHTTKGKEMPTPIYGGRSTDTV